MVLTQNKAPPNFVADQKCRSFPTKRAINWAVATIWLFNVATWGALSARKKSDIQQNLLFEDPGWERLENLNYRNFWSFQVCSGSSHALAALSIT